jgi:hypothetical protein
VVFWNLTLGLWPMLTACSTVRTRTLQGGTVSMTEAQFAAHFEHVFRYHNRITSELIDTLSNLDADNEEPPELSEAEEDMHEACEPLNEVVSLEAVSQHAGFWTENELPEAVPACEEATQHVETLLRESFHNQHLHSLHSPNPPAAGGK